MHFFRVTLLRKVNTFLGVTFSNSGDKLSAGLFQRLGSQVQSASSRYPLAAKSSDLWCVPAIRYCRWSIYLRMPPTLNRHRNAACMACADGVRQVLSSSEVTKIYGIVDVRSWYSLLTKFSG